HGKRLRRLAIPARLLQFVLQDRIRLSQPLEVPGCDWPKATHCQPWARKRMPPHRLFRQAEFQPEPAHLVLEQIFERLDQLKSQLPWQPADVVMRLDRRRRAVKRGSTLDDVWIQRALGEKVGIANPLCLVLEYIDEHMADNPAFLLRIIHSG